MSNYSDVIRQARKAEKQKDGKDERMNTRKPEDQKDGKLVRQQEVKPENQKADVSGGEVNLSIKVSKNLRRHWVSEAKRRDTTLTAAIIGALTEKFGLPVED